MNQSKLSAERARELFAYDPETGSLTWRVNKGRAKAGEVAGHPQPNGYRRMRIDQSSYWAHRVAWLMVHGAWPRGHLDHLNGNPSDNSIRNLREVSSRGNQENQRRPHRDSKVGVLGVQRASKSTFSARITVGYASVYIGVFSTPEEAHQAYLTAKRQLHAGCTV